MSGKEAFLGEINISDDVIAELAGFAALECYGVVGMASPSLRAGVARLLSRDKLKKGIKIGAKDGGVSIDLYVVIEYGTNLAEVARNLSSRVQYLVEKFAELKVKNVEVHVQGVKVRKKTKKSQK